jgi:hypothetical protein
MDDHRSFYRFRLRWLLLLFIPLSIILALYSRAVAERKLRVDAYNRMNRLGMDAHLENDGDFILLAKKANVTDSDLRALAAILRAEGHIGGHKVTRFELFGSAVSDTAVADFQKAAPHCELVR